MTMWATDQVHQDRLTDQLNTMQKRLHENPALAAKGHMQHRWFRSKLRALKPW